MNKTPSSFASLSGSGSGSGSGSASATSKRGRVPIHDIISQLRSDPLQLRSGFLTKPVHKVYCIFGHAESLDDKPENYFKLNSYLLFLARYACGVRSSASDDPDINKKIIANLLDREYRRIYKPSGPQAPSLLSPHSVVAPSPHLPSASLSSAHNEVLEHNGNGETFLRFLDSLLYPIGHVARSGSNFFGYYSENSVIRLHQPCAKGERILDSRVLAESRVGSSNGIFEGIIEFDLKTGRWRNASTDFSLMPLTDADRDYFIEKGKKDGRTGSAVLMPPYVWNSHRNFVRYKPITLKALILEGIRHGHIKNPRSPGFDEHSYSTIVSFGCRGAETGVDPLTAETPKVSGVPSPDSYVGVGVGVGVGSKRPRSPSPHRRHGGGGRGGKYRVTIRRSRLLRRSRCRSRRRKCK